MQIDIDLNSNKSINDAIKELDSIAKKMESICKEITEKIAKLGKEVVDKEYRAMDENKPFDVYCAQTDKGWAIIAEGENVVFLEFGTGVYTTDYSHPDAEGLPPIEAGEWSKSEGSGVFARHGHWHYRKKYYEGTTATHGFYFAKKEMKEQAVLIAKEVFHKWLM